MKTRAGSKRRGSARTWARWAKARIAALEKDLAEHQAAADEAIAEWRKNHEAAREKLMPFRLQQGGDTVLGAIDRLIARVTDGEERIARLTEQFRTACDFEDRWKAAERQRIAEREAFEKREAELRTQIDVETPRRYEALRTGLRALVDLTDGGDHVASQAAKTLRERISEAMRADFGLRRRL